MSQMTTDNPSDIRPPGPLAVSFVRLITGFGVWFAIGLAPFLGRVNIRGFTAVIAMYPATLQWWLIPLSGLFMGMIGVIVEFASTARIAQRTLTRWFVTAAALFFVFLVVMMWAYLQYVARVHQAVRDEAGNVEQITRAIVTGAPKVPTPLPNGCPCKAGEDAATCIGERTLEQRTYGACFPNANFAEFPLAVIYLLLTGSFAAAVGLLLLTKRRQNLTALSSGETSISKADGEAATGGTGLT